MNKKFIKNTAIIIITSLSLGLTQANTIQSSKIDNNVTALQAKANHSNDYNYPNSNNRKDPYYNYNSYYNNRDNDRYYNNTSAGFEGIFPVLWIAAFVTILSKIADF